MRFESGVNPANVRSWKLEVCVLRTEVEYQKSWKQKIQCTYDRASTNISNFADRDLKLEVGSRKLEVGSWKLETASWKLEVGSWKLGLGSWCAAKENEYQTNFESKNT